MCYAGHITCVINCLFDGFGKREDTQILPYNEHYKPLIDILCPRTALKRNKNDLLQIISSYCNIQTLLDGLFLYFILLSFFHQIGNNDLSCMIRSSGFTQQGSHFRISVYDSFFVSRIICQFI